MEHLADNGNGSYSYVDGLTSTLQVITLDAKVQVDLNPEVVASYRLIGYENRDVYRQLLRSNSLDFHNDAGETAAASGQFL
jgi:Ca-activated chloride channel family protein